LGLSTFSVLVATLVATAGTPVPKHAGLTAEGLGERLFNDARLSADGTVSCASCHRAETAFADHEPVARGIRGRRGTRNAPSILNVDLTTTFFWDGRRVSLEDQIGDPFVNANEHGLPSHDALLDLIGSDPSYENEFREIFGSTTSDAVSLRHVEQAIAAFLRSLSREPSPFDRFRAGEKTALTESQRRGLLLFEGRAQCTACHRSDGERAPLTDNDFHATRLPASVLKDAAAKAALLAGSAPAERFALVGERADVASLGRFVVTLDPNDLGKFRTPSLRNVASTAPYMHNGSVATLEQAIQIEHWA
jgi:cytochrome c peroxidase